MASTPALPWGVNAAVAADGGAPKRDRADDPAEDESARAEKQRKLEEAAARDVSALAAVGLKEGARVEVLWEVETGGDTGGGALTAHWWGGVVTWFPGAAMYDADGARVWTLTYDAKPALGVQHSDEHLVTFRSANALYDVSAEHPMPWRLEDATGGVVSTPDDAPEDAATTVADDAKKGEGADEAEAAKQKDVSALAAVGLTVGCRLEVLWDVAKGGEGGEEFTAEWWGCTLSPQQGTRVYDTQGIRVWELQYDPKPHLDSPDGSFSMVTFVSNYELFDMALQSGFSWRLEGAECLAPPETVTFTEVMEAQEAMNKEEGLDSAELERLGMAALKELPAEKQYSILTGFRDFSDRLKERLDAVMEEKGPLGSDGEPYVITVDDMNGIIADLRRNGA